MARDNRKDNREKAKEAANANANADGEKKEPTGFEIDDMLTTIDDVDEEDADAFDTGDKSGDDSSGADDNDDDENAAKREADAKAKADTKTVDKKGEEEAKKAGEADDKSKASDDGKKSDEVGETAEAKALREAKEVEDKTKADAAKKAEPTAEEKKAQEEADAAKVIADKAKAEAEAALKAKEAPKTLSDEEAAELFTEWRSTTEKLLAEHHYKLSEEEVAVLNENPAEFIPKAMSRVYLDCVSAAFQQFVTYLPRMVFQVLEQREANNSQENAFFTSWPALKEHRETVLRLGAAYRASNPTATVEDFINEVGAQSMVALRLTPDGAKTNGDAGKAAETNGKEKAFKPASGTGVNEPPKAKDDNPFAQMAREFGMQVDEEDLDDS